MTHARIMVALMVAMAIAGAMSTSACSRTCRDVCEDQCEEESGSCEPSPAVYCVQQCGPEKTNDSD